MAITLKNKLRAIRAELDMTQEQFARAIGMQKTTYIKKENMLHSFTVEEAIAISQVSNKSIEDIFLSTKLPNRLQAIGE